MNAARALAPHLPQVSDFHARACSHLLALLASAGLPAHAAAADSSPARGWRIELDSDYGPLGFMPIRGGGRPLALTCDDGAPDLTRAGAALEASEALIASIERALDTPLWPGPIRPDEFTEPGGAAVHVRVDADGGDCAMLSVPSERVCRLPAPRWHAPPRGLLDLRVRCRVRIGGCTIDTDRLAGIRPADLLLQTLQTGPRWTVQVWASDGPKRGATFHPGRATMNLHTEEPVDMDPLRCTAVPPGAGSDPSYWQRIATELRFELPAIDLPLGAVAGLQPGAVLRIAAPQSVLPVEVFAGDRLIAHGELVAIGDGYGVRVIECMIDAP